MTATQTVLFVCIHNSARSQMAARDECLTRTREVRDAIAQRVAAWAASLSPYVETARGEALARRAVTRMWERPQL